METILNFNALEKEVKKWKADGKSLENILSFIEGGSVFLGALITPKGQSPYKTIQSLSFTQRGALEKMIRLYIPTIY